MLGRGLSFLLRRAKFLCLCTLLAAAGFQVASGMGSVSLAVILLEIFWFASCHSDFCYLGLTVKLAQILRKDSSGCICFRKGCLSYLLIFSRTTA